MKDFMLEAIRQAKIGLKLGEVPVGAVIVKDNEIISSCHNLKETVGIVTAHAEMLAIQNASEILSNWRLTGCSMYVTLEPCPMCAGAIFQCRINKLYIGTFDPTMGACGSVVNILQNRRLNRWVDIQWMYNEQCSEMLEKFFKSRR